jgi:drug/metabolite transporter (DMT)-like permease
VVAGRPGAVALDMARSAGTARVWAALAVVYVVWGSTYLAIDLAVETLPSFLMLAVRFLVAGAILYLLSSRGAERPRLVHWRSALAVGGALLLLGNGGVAYAVEHVDTGVVALIVGSVPLWMALLDRVIYGQRLAPVAVAGLVLGFGGIAFLARPSGDGSLVGVIVVLLGSLAWAAGSLYARNAPAPANALQGASMQMLAGAALLGVAGLSTGELGELSLAAASGTSLLALVYLITLGSLVGFSAYIWLLKVAPTHLVGTYAYVNPVVAVLLGTLWLGEPITLNTLVGGAAIVVAVALIVSARPVAETVPRRALFALPARGR